jgi:outer membrane protein OmpA-like peptidoglycan-associated protein
MRRRHRLDRQAEANIWLGYTDLLSNGLFLLLLTVSLTTLTRSLDHASANKKPPEHKYLNDKPPLLQLTEKDAFRFPTSSYALTPAFKAALDSRLPEIRANLRDYRTDVIEVIGHTDGVPNGNRLSNLDDLLPRAGQAQFQGRYRVGSNSDLGLLRAAAVAKQLRDWLDPDGRQKLTFRPYSAASLINTDGQWRAAASAPQAERRRIELRFTRTDPAAPPREPS